MEGLHRQASLARLIDPASIAVIGGREAERVVEQCRRLGFEGTIWPVNPNRESLAGLDCFASVDDLPAPPDAAFVAVPAEASIAVVEALSRIGAGGTVCYAAGFKERDANGARRQERLVAAACAMPLIGPNCYGLINYMSGVALWPDQHGGERVESGAAIIAQSGNLAINFTMQRRCLPVASVITVGNQAAVGIEPALEACLDDRRIRAIGLYVEGFTDLPAFVRAAETARSRRVPLVVFKAGRSAAGAKLALSHTASLTGEDGLCDALFQRLGVARVRTPEDFVETLALLTAFGPLDGSRLATISCSGAEATIFADLAADTGIDLPALGEDQKADLRSLLGDTVHTTNPFDFHTFIWGDEAMMTRCFETVLGGAIDFGLFSIDIPRDDRCTMDDWWPTLNAITTAASRTGTKTAVVSTLPENMSTLPENMPEPVGTFLIERGILPLHGLDRALSAIKAAVDLGAAWHHPPPAPEMAGASADGSLKTWDEVEAKQALAVIGVSVPPSEVVTGVPAAVAAAASLDCPVVLKAVSADIVHKTEEAAVVLDLHDAKAVETAARGLFDISKRVLVEAMVTDAVAELIIGVDRDPQFGPYMVVGFGGVTVELISDSRILLLPLDRGEAEAALLSLRTASLLQGYRGQAPGDIAAVVDAVLAVAGFVEDNRDRIAEIDINPLMVRPQGLGAVAVDAYIRTVEGKDHG